MRLDKFISNTTHLSRSQARREIRQGYVTVNGNVITDPSHHTDDDDNISYTGKVLSKPGPRYYMLHKPEGTVCASKDSRHMTVMDLLDVPNAERLHVAGRLDIDTTGLVLITDDGAWSHSLTSGKKKCPKTYRVFLAEPLTEKAIMKISEGILLEGETRKTKPAIVEQISGTEALLTITEGKYHQVKRMFAAVGNKVESLHREKIGNLCLDPALAPGEWRELSEDEINNISK